MTDLINSLIFAVMSLILIIFIVDPEAIGKQLQRIDAARFQYENDICYEYDYTLDSEIP